MHKPIKISICLLLGQTALAAEQNNTYQKALEGLTNRSIEITSVKATPVDGIKEVVIKNGPGQEIVYMSENGEHLFSGQLMSLKNKQNLTELTQKSMRKELMEGFAKTHKGIDFLPEQMTEHVTVFTDIDCGVCRKFHQEVDQYNELGIGITYLFFPRAGINSASHQKAVNVWCSEDQQSAMTQAKSGVNLPPLMCPNPIETQFNLGLGAGINGTPFIVLEDGTLLPGFVPPQQLKQRLGLLKQQNP